MICTRIKLKSSEAAMGAFYSLSIYDTNIKQADT